MDDPFTAMKGVAGFWLETLTRPSFPEPILPIILEAKLI